MADVAILKYICPTCGQEKRIVVTQTPPKCPFCGRLMSIKYIVVLPPVSKGAW